MSYFSIIFQGRRQLRPILFSHSISRLISGNKIENKYSPEEKDKILKIINNTDIQELSRYEITKNRIKNFSEWRNNNGQIKSLGDVELIDGFTEKTTLKLFNSILDGPKVKEENAYQNKIKGQILHPSLSDTVIEKCRSVLSVYVAVHSVCWTLINKSNYEVLEWKYHRIDYREGKKLQLTDILDIAQTVTNQLPVADVYVMKAEPTTLRATGSDPNNPKVLAVNLQMSQMIAMIVALINARKHEDDFIEEESYDSKDVSTHKVYFLRPSLPYRLYGTLVGNEKVSTGQTIEMLLQDIKEYSKDKSQVYISRELKSMFMSQKELQKDMLGHCLLLGLTFMDLCMYKNQNKINKLLKRGT